MFPAGTRLLKATCIDSKCQAVLCINAAESVVECFKCGQKYSKSVLQDVREVPTEEISTAFQNIVQRYIINRYSPKRGTEMVKVLGLSNYYCKLLSPLLTKFGMDKDTSQPKLLTEMNQGEILDCGIFGDRAFLIEPDHLNIPGFGRDITGSIDYLAETLKLIVASNGNEERLVPIHADGDGHCLVHAISRALVGRELFWHPLRCCLKKHFETNIQKYKDLFQEFIDSSEWMSIIEECDPNFQPPEGELHGLRNIHIFGLANVLRRPIILLDSLECMQKCGDYSALFLPGFVDPEACRGKDKSLNKPICIAWSSYSHNHYIPLVGVQRKPLPVLPASLIPKVWGMPQSQIASYMEFTDNGGCVIGGRVLSENYIQRLVNAMEMKFYELHGVHPSLVSDVKLYLYQDNILFPAKPIAVIERTKSAVQNSRLYRCLTCRALCELHIDDKWLASNAAKYNQTLQNLKRGSNDSYSFTYQGIFCKYDNSKDEFVIDLTRSKLQTCSFCKTEVLRKVTNDGTVIFKPEDKELADRSILFSEQAKKFFPQENLKQSQQQKEQQQPTKDKSNKLELKLQWNDKCVVEKASCPEFTSNDKENVNEFVKKLSQRLIDKYFSEDSSNPELKTYIYEEIWKQIKKLNIVDNAESYYKHEMEKESKVPKLSTEVKPEVPTSSAQYVKVVTYDSKQESLLLPNDGISYGQLQEWIKEKFNIPVKNQRIKSGFPPKEILPSGDSNKQMLALKHGDRLLVEKKKEMESSSLTQNKNNSLNSSTRSYSVNDDIPSQTTSHYHSDLLWDFLIYDHINFKKNGFLYKKMAEKYSLHEKLHGNIEDLPGKILCYNPHNDSIEICVKGVGHFSITPDLNYRIQAAKEGHKVTEFSKCPLVKKTTDPKTSVFSRPSTEQSSNTPKKSLLRKGPGFSVLTRPPDDMDIS